MSNDREHFESYREQTRAKHTILEKYIVAYFNILKGNNKNLVYIDGFAGRGFYTSPETGEAVDGSPLRALKKIAAAPLPVALPTYLQSDALRTPSGRGAGAPDPAEHEGERRSALVPAAGEAMTVAEIERLLRLGMCSPGRHREVGCATCDACEAAIAEVRRLAEVERQARALVDSFKGTHSIREMTGPGIAALNLLLNALDELKAKRKTEARRDA